MRSWDRGRYSVFEVNGSYSGGFEQFWCNVKTVLGIVGRLTLNGKLELGVNVVSKGNGVRVGIIVY